MNILVSKTHHVIMMNIKVKMLVEKQKIIKIKNENGLNILESM
jgi:hypothetical protein